MVIVGNMSSSFETQSTITSPEYVFILFILLRVLYPPRYPNDGEQFIHDLTTYGEVAIVL